MKLNENIFKMLINSQSIHMKKRGMIIVHGLGLLIYNDCFTGLRSVQSELFIKESIKLTSMAQF